MTLLLLLGCASEPPDAVLAYVREEDGYAIAPRAIAALDDAGAVSGDLGTVRFGGRITSGSPPTYTGGTPVDVRYELVARDAYARVAVPLDQDGLLLWSFYGHLADARDALADRGVDLSPIFPVALAWNASATPLFELSPSDNAGYAIGSNLFLLLPDGDDRPVPLLANAGVVVHELGHAALHLRMVGDPLVQPIAEDASTVAGKWQASIHEGFADSLATLLLDDPHFMEVSLDMPARRVDGDAVARDSLLPTEGEGLADALVYDPYALGTVLASASWDVRLALDDPDRALALLFRAVDTWAPTSPDDLDGARFLSAWVAAAADATERAAVCDAVDRRFAGLVTAEGCE